MQYYAGFAAFFLVIAGWVYLANFYQAPTCFDGRHNGEETGVDCGGSCVRICAFTVQEPVVKWSRSFRVTSGIYNAVAYVENTNLEAASAEVNYTFTLYDEAGLITERKGTTILPPDGSYPIFEGRIETGNRIPTRTFIEVEPPKVWQPATSGRGHFTVVDRELSGADGKPLLEAVLRNEGLEEVREVEVVATIFDSAGTALATSRTFVDNFAPRSDTQIVFTWPEPIATTLRSCEIPTDVLLTIDMSGSMDSDGVNPPQPLTAVKEAANRFIGRLGSEDQVGVVTFATDAALVKGLGTDAKGAATAVSALSIASKEQTGYTNPGEGLKAAATELTSSRHNGDARKVLVLLTDGLATAPGTTEEAEAYALAEAAKVKDSEIEIYAIGLGKEVNMNFVRAIASSPSQSYQALDRNQVDSIYEKITASICEDGPAVIDIVPKSTSGFVPLR